MRISLIPRRLRVFLSKSWEGSGVDGSEGLWVEVGRIGRALVDTQKEQSSRTTST